MALQLQPPPYQSAQGSIQWAEWFRIINDLLDNISGDIGEIANVTITDAGDNEFLTFDSGTSQWINQTFEELGGISLDTSPQLGGDLDTNGFDIIIDDEAHFNTTNGTPLWEWSYTGSGSVSHYLRYHAQSSTGPLLILAKTNSGTVAPITLGVLGVDSDLTFSTNESRKMLTMSTPDLNVVNHLHITPSLTGETPILSSLGSDTDVGITITPKGTGPLIVSSTVDDANPGPELQLYRNRGTGVDGDEIGFITWYADNKVGTKTPLAMITVDALDLDDATEDTVMTFHTTNGGADPPTAIWNMRQGIYYQNGSHMGAGTINTAGWYFSNKAVHVAPSTVTAATVAQTATQRFMLADCTSNAIDIELETVSVNGDGRIYTVKLINAANAVTINADGAELIDGSNSLTISNLYDSVTLITDETQWHII